MAALEFAKYRGGTWEPFNEVSLNIPCLYKGQLYVYTAAIYVTSDEAPASGRELWGLWRYFGCKIHGSALLRSISATCSR